MAGACEIHGGQRLELDCTGQQSNDHPVRHAIVALLEKDPGLHLKGLCEATGSNRGTATHHLRVLERAGRVASVSAGRERRFFLARAGEHPFCWLLQGRTRQVATAVADVPGASQKTLVENAAVGRNTLRAHMDRLIAHGLVNEVRDGRARRYYPTQRLAQLIDQVEPRDGEAQP